VLRTIVASPRVPQLVVPFSTSPLTAILFAITELTELDERRLLEDTATEDDESDEEDTSGDELDDGATDEGATDDGAEEERADDTIADDTTADELERLLLDKTACELLPPTIPQGAGCAAQVEREIQLLLFS
jgi:phosphopantothenoylcysteine synthetase/decarboxylase